MTTLLDASALLASINEERGANTVETALSDAAMSSVNVAEVASKLTEHGWSPTDIGPLFEQLQLSIIPFDLSTALQSGQLRQATRNLGLSLGDRACLATAMAHSMDVLTADKTWGKLKIRGLTIITLR
ncbi:MAG: type II toxin-antitoxin system VapC family toxin [Pseudomonadota bacterium]